jgi:hypothetical protein
MLLGAGAERIRRAFLEEVVYGLDLKRQTRRGIPGDYEKKGQ